MPVQVRAQFIRQYDPRTWILYVWRLRPIKDVDEEGIAETVLVDVASAGEKYHAVKWDEC